MCLTMNQPNTNGDQLDAGVCTYAEAYIEERRSMSKISCDVSCHHIISTQDIRTCFLSHLPPVYWRRKGLAMPPSSHHSLICQCCVVCGWVRPIKGPNTYWKSQPGLVLPPQGASIECISIHVAEVLSRFWMCLHISAPTVGKWNCGSFVSKCIKHYKIASSRIICWHCINRR